MTHHVFRNRIRIRILVLGLLPLLASGGLAAADEPGDEGMTPMFDGKSFAGWNKVGGGATYEMVGDEIGGKVGPGSNTFLRTARTYGDYIRKLERTLDIPSNTR